MNGELKELNPKFNETFLEVLKEIDIVWQAGIENNFEAGISFIEIKTVNGAIELF